MSDKPRINQREWRLQAYADRFIDRVVLPPMFTTGIDAASQATDNQRARAAGRGVVFGMPDCMVAQGDGDKLQTVAWIEYKRGTGLTARQEGTHKALQSVGFQVYTASSIVDVYDALQLAGFRLHGNASNIARESEERLLAADEKAAQKKHVAVRAKASVPKASRTRIAKWNRIQSGNLP